MSSTADGGHPVKCDRSVGWLWRMPTTVGVLRITIGQKTDYYFVRPLESDYGHVYEMGKLVENQGITDTYTINLENNNETCTCPAGVYRGKCKHVDSLKAMKAEGRL